MCGDWIEHGFQDELDDLEVRQDFETDGIYKGKAQGVVNLVEEFEHVRQ